MPAIVPGAIASLLRRTANVLAASFFGVIMLGIFLLLLARVPFDDWLLSTSSSEVDWTRRAILAASLAVMSIYAGAILCRVLARLFPLRSDRHPRYIVIALHLLALVLFVALLVEVSWPDPEGERAREALSKNLREYSMKGQVYYDARFVVETISEVVIVAFTIYAFFLAVVPVSLSVWRHIRRPRPTGVLFLRRFGSPVEASLMSAMMRCAPEDAALAFIGSPGGVPASWDPVSLSLSGLPWLKPWSRIPIYLRTSDEAWVTEVAHLIEQSRTIVFDTSELSESVRLEWELIVKLEAEPRTLLLEPVGTTFAEGKHAKRLAYDCSWSAATPRLLLGTFLAASAGFIAAEYIGAVLGVLAVALPIGHKSLAPEARAGLRALLAVGSVSRKWYPHSPERTDT